MEYWASDMWYGTVPLMARMGSGEAGEEIDSIGVKSDSLVVRDVCWDS